MLEGWFALDLLVEGGRCTGVLALPPGGGGGGGGGPVEVRADHVVLATGGAGQLFSVTTNPAESTGDGVAMALRAGVPTADVEFVQFHPTALHHPAMPRPLLSEALRGHGALLRDRDGERFVDELAPRDVVSRAMAARMAEQGVDHLWLDATGLERFPARFPTIAASLSSIGLDPQRDWLPIAPAAHHLSGGVVTDLWGATALPGLWAVGEVACTGVHGANRLASNSLLEGMVFGARLAERIPSGARSPEPSGALRAVLGEEPIDGIECTELVQPATPLPPDPDRWPDAGRDETARHRAAGHDARRRCRAQRRVAGAARAPSWRTRPPRSGTRPPRSAPGSWRTCCGWRTRCWPPRSPGPRRRGAHARREYPETDPAWRRRLVHGHAGRDGEDRRG